MTAVEYFRTKLPLFALSYQFVRGNIPRFYITGRIRVSLSIMVYIFPKTLGFIKSDSLPFIIDTPSGQFLFCHGDRIAPAFGHIDQQGKVREAEYIIGIQLIGQFFFLFSRSPAISARQTDHPRPVAVPKAEVRPYRLLEDSG